MKSNVFTSVIILFFIASCSSGPAKKENPKNGSAQNTDSLQARPVADAATIFAKKEVLASFAPSATFLDFFNASV